MCVPTTRTAAPSTGTTKRCLNYATAAAAAALMTDPSRRERADTLNAPARPHAPRTTISGDGWTFKAGAGWVVHEGARKGDYEAVRQQP
jgi:hypothetical protein